LPGKISEISIVFLVFAENFIVNFASEGNKTKLFRITAIFPQKLLIYTELLYFLMLCATMKANKPYHLIWVIYPEKAMDNIDIKILNLLKQNARMSNFNSAFEKTGSTSGVFHHDAFDNVGYVFAGIASLL
jgi:hypothetical protein